MFRKMLPFLLAAVVLSVVLSILFATQRMGLIHPSLARFRKRETDLQVESETTDPAREG